VPLARMALLVFIWPVGRVKCVAAPDGLGAYPANRFVVNVGTVRRSLGRWPRRGFSTTVPIRAEEA
jgi:hypothetical protein